MMSHRALRYLLAALAVVVVAIILWVDLSTDLWQKYVVMSGLAGGLVTFVLTALVVDRLVARAAHERWAPVTRIALGDLRRRLGEEPVTHAPARLRRLPDARRRKVLAAAAAEERDLLAAALARWASFLASSADVTDVVDSVARLVGQLDDISELVHEPTTGADRLDEAVAAYHSTGDTLLAQIEATIAAEAKYADR